MQLTCPHINRTLSYSCHSMTSLAPDERIKKRSLPSELPELLHSFIFIPDTCTVVWLQSWPALYLCPCSTKQYLRSIPEVWRKGSIQLASSASTLLPVFLHHQITLLFIKRKRTAKSLIVCGPSHIIIPAYIAQYHTNMGNQDFQLMLFLSHKNLGLNAQQYNSFQQEPQKI